MSQQQINRLERLEAFVEKLKLGSYIAKAAAEDRQVTFGDPRLVERGEQVLAEAATAYTDPDALLAIGDKEIGDATMMGTFSSYVSQGNIAAAQNLLNDVRERNRVAKAVDLATDLTAELTQQDDAELRERFGKLEQAFALIVSRLDRLETRPRRQAATVSGPTVAKAANVSKKRRRTPQEEASRLHGMLDAYVDDANRVGVISSMIQKGELSEARALLESAKAAHEIQKIRNERNGFRK